MPPSGRELAATLIAAFLVVTLALCLAYGLIELVKAIRRGGI